MTGPYQTPSNQPGSDGWPGGDINSPFGQSDPHSPFSPGSEPRRDESDEPSPYEGVQYELETPGGPPTTVPPQPPYAPVTGPPISGPPVTGPPMMPTPGYGPPQGPPQPAYAPQPVFPPPQQPASSGSNGALIGGIIAGVVVLLVLAGIVIIVATSGGDDTDGGTSAGGSEHKAVDDLCAAVDLTAFTNIAAADGDPSSSTTTSGGSSTASCSGYIGDITTETTASFYIYSYVYEDAESASSAFDYDYTLEGCDTKEVTGSWEKGNTGTGGSGCGISINDYYAAITILDGNMMSSIQLDLSQDLADASDPVAAVTSVAESVMSATKA